VILRGISSDAYVRMCVYRQTSMSSAVNEVKTHMANIGRMIEDMESDMRNNLGELYIKKTREVCLGVEWIP
jgi:hypothetical protein